MRQQSYGGKAATPCGRYSVGGGFNQCCMAPRSRASSSGHPSGIAFVGSRHGSYQFQPRNIGGGRMPWHRTSSMGMPAKYLRFLTRATTRRDAGQGRSAQFLSRSHTKYAARARASAENAGRNLARPVQLGRAKSADAAREGFTKHVHLDIALGQSRGMGTSDGEHTRFGGLPIVVGRVERDR